MEPSLDFSLPDERRQPGRKAGSRSSRLLCVLCALQAVILGVLLWQMRPNRTSRANGSAAELRISRLRSLAQKLEQQGLSAAAVRTWHEVLARRDGDVQGAAAIWYRIGTVQQRSGAYEEALESYYRSESLAPLPGGEGELGRRVEECLQALGKVAALRYELAERVAVPGSRSTAGADVLAEIGSLTLTRADIDREMEAAARRQIDRLAPYMPAERLKEQQQALLQRLADDSSREQFLGQFISRELLVRKALDDRLRDDPEVRVLLLESERETLAREVLQRTLAARISIAAEDVRAYYEANLQGFSEPAAAQVAHILVADAERAQAVRNSLANGSDFEQLARTVSEDVQTAAAAGVIPGWLSADAAVVPGVGESPDFLAAVFRTPAGSVAAQDVSSPAGVHVIKVLQKREARQRPFDEVRDEAYRQLRVRREREVQEQLFNDLRERYDVVIHTSRLGREIEPGSGEPASRNTRSMVP